MANMHFDASVIGNIGNIAANMVTKYPELKALEKQEMQKEAYRGQLDEAWQSITGAIMNDPKQFQQVAQGLGLSDEEMTQKMLKWRSNDKSLSTEDAFKVRKQILEGIIPHVDSAQLTQQAVGGYGSEQAQAEIDNRKYKDEIGRFTSEKVNDKLTAEDVAKFQAELKLGDNVVAPWKQRATANNSKRNQKQLLDNYAKWDGSGSLTSALSQNVDTSDKATANQLDRFREDLSMSNKISQVKASGDKGVSAKLAELGFKTKQEQAKAIESSISTQQKVIDFLEDSLAESKDKSSVQQRIKVIRNKINNLNGQRAELWGTDTSGEDSRVESADAQYAKTALEGVKNLWDAKVGVGGNQGTLDQKVNKIQDEINTKNLPYFAIANKTDGTVELWDNDKIVMTLGEGKKHGDYVKGEISSPSAIAEAGIESTGTGGRYGASEAVETLAEGFDPSSLTEGGIYIIPSGQTVVFKNGKFELKG